MLPIWWVLNKVIDKNEGLVFDQIHKRPGHMEFCYQKPPGERSTKPSGPFPRGRKVGIMGIGYWHAQYIWPPGEL
jgi:hypothetical protein